MAEFPFVALDVQTATGNGTIALTYQVPQGREFVVQDVVFASTGAFSIRGISTTSNYNFGNLSSAKPLLSTMIKLAGNANNVLKFPAMPFTLKGGEEIQFDLVDTTGSSNAITVALSGMIKV